MFGFRRKKKSIELLPRPVGMPEIMICVFDENQQLLHHFQSTATGNGAPEGAFKLLNNPDHAFESFVLREAVNSRKSTSMAFSQGAGGNTYLYILPYPKKQDKWRFVCMQVAMGRPNPQTAGSALTEDRVCLLLTNSAGGVLSAGSNVPAAFEYSAESLVNLNLADFFAPADLGMILSCAADTNESILSCVFRGRDGAKRDVEVKKFSVTDHCTLYRIYDVTQSHFSEDIIQVSTRERRRIGQDLHDSIGQLLTGISLLSRSLANSLQREGDSSAADAAQISELADDASNQIRQISRGLMPSDIVQRGLFASLRDLARITTDSCGLTCEAQLDEHLEFSDGAVETHLFRIAQEAVNNAVRHADASRIDIIVSEINGMPQLEVRDDGVWKGKPDHADGIGMKTMHYRASVICGQLAVGPAEGGGTNVVCRLEMDELLETRA